MVFRDEAAAEAARAALREAALIGESGVKVGPLSPTGQTLVSRAASSMVFNIVCMGPPDASGPASNPGRFLDVGHLCQLWQRQLCCGLCVRLPAEALRAMRYSQPRAAAP